MFLKPPQLQYKIIIFLRPIKYLIDCRQILLYFAIKALRKATGCATAHKSRPGFINQNQESNTKSCIKPYH